MEGASTGGLDAINGNQAVRLAHHLMSIVGVPLLGFLLISQWTDYRQTIDLVSQQQIIITQLSASLSEGLIPRVAKLEIDVERIQNTRFTRTEADQVSRRLDRLEEEIKELRLVVRQVVLESRGRQRGDQ